LEQIGKGRFEIALSVPLVFECEDTVLGQSVAAGLSQADVDALLDYFCRVAHLQQIFFLWRPLLPDPKDDLFLELAVAAGCEAIVTHNVRDFTGAAVFGVGVLGPAAFLRRIGVLE
jgi:predicted nucleic acid-binding protein